MGRSDRKADCPDSPASGLEHVASVRNPWVLRLLRPSASPFDANGAIRCPLPPRRAALAPGPPPLHRGCPLGLPHGPALCRNRRLLASGARRDRRGHRSTAPLDPPSVLPGACAGSQHRPARSEEHTSELQSLMRISYAVFFL